MKSEFVIIISGVIMVVSGGVLFYTIQVEADMDQLLRYTKHAGTFIGLAGIGVIMAGILLSLMSKEEVPIEESFGEQN